MNEITVTASLKASKGSASFNRPRSSYGVTWNTARHSSNTQAIGTTQEALSVGTDIGTLGWAHLTNLDPTNYVDIGLNVSGNFQGLLRLKPGESQVFRFMPGIVPYARANTAAVDLEWNILND